MSAGQMPCNDSESAHVTPCVTARGNIRPDGPRRYHTGLIWRITSGLGLLRTVLEPRRALAVLAVLGCALALVTAPAAASARPATAGHSAFARPADGPNGEYVSLLFSRTEVTGADTPAGATACQPDDDYIARLDTMVAPYLQSLGLTATGTLQTSAVQPTTGKCVHGGDSEMASWADAANLADNYGWTFGSATATYPGPTVTPNLTPTQQWAETCGSQQAIADHGLPGAAGIIDYPGLQNSTAAVQNLQSTWGTQCFAWGRQFGNTGVTNSSAGTTSPYWQTTTAVKGGPCNDPTQPCYTIAAQGSQRYTLPSTIITKIENLQPGQWFTLQAYLLVTDTNPQYTTNGTQWDCTSADPAEHWSNDVERYCYSDYQQIMQALACDHNVTVTDPLSVGVAFGRPASYTIPPQP